jgi:MoaA/NifB/PqqE/SkfB family radical SAM enzyme
MSEAVAAVPDVPFRGLRTLWFQVTGTLCNLVCRHCFNSSGPRDPWLESLDIGTVRRYIAEAEALGVREFYFTGGEPFMHPDLIGMVEEALAVAPVTILTNGTLIDETLATRLTHIAAAAAYSLEIRISLDAPTAEENDAVRGHGSFAAALRAVRLLANQGLYPIVTATEVLDPSPEGLYGRLRARLIEVGVKRPRIKILPVLPMGRCAGREADRTVTVDDLEGFDLTRLQCTETRVVAEGGIYACPILAGLVGARLGKDGLADALAPAALYHTACYTCYERGLSCKNF